MRKALLIIPAQRAFVTDPGADALSLGKYHSMKDLFEANIVIVRDSSHFCCIKNRYSDEADKRDRIPIRMMMSYIRKYTKHFTEEELVETILAVSNDQFTSDY